MLEVGEPHRDPQRCQCRCHTESSHWNSSSRVEVTGVVSAGGLAAASVEAWALLLVRMSAPVLASARSLRVTSSLVPYAGKKKSPARPGPLSDYAELGPDSISGPAMRL